MKYCENCGNQLTDNAVFCPKCGTHVGGNSETPQTVKNNNQNQEEGLTTAQKITLGVVAFIAFSGVFTGEWIPVIICICVLAAVVAIFMGAIETKYAWKTAICCAIAVMIAAVTAADKEEESSNNENSAPKIEQKQESEADRKTREQKEKQEKKNKILKDGYDTGYKNAMQYTYKMDHYCRSAYINNYGAPQTEEEIQLYKQFVEQYDKGWEAGRKVRDNM